MKKSCYAVLIGLFFFSGLIFALKSFGVTSAGGADGKKSGVATSREAGAKRLDPGELPFALQSALSEKLGENDLRYRVIRSGAGYRAVNRRNRLAATMGSNGFTVRAGSYVWGLRLTAWGAGGRLQNLEAGKAVCSANRVDIDLGAVAGWWANGPLGIEQGWTVGKRPQQDVNRGPLILILRESGNLRAHADSSADSLDVSTTAGREVLRYTGLTAYDKTGRKLPAHFEASGKELRVVVDDTRAVYPVRIDPWVQAAKLTASDGAGSDDFGCSVALSYDGTTLVAGARGASGGSDAGAVYVFQEAPSGWANATEAAKLTASDGAAGDTLGYSVSVSWNGATVVAAAPAATVGSNASQGAVYVFQKPASGWADRTQTARLTASDGAAGDTLGFSVAVSPDGGTVVAGAPGATVGGNPSQGAVYVFQAPASGWANATQTAKLTASVGGGPEELGASVAVSSGGATVAAGAPGTTVWGNSAQGALYVFQAPASGWQDATETAMLTAPHGAAQDELGYSVAITPDGSIIVAGAPAATLGGNSAQGLVYLFQILPSGWANGIDGAGLTPADGAAGDRLGYSVAVSSDGETVVAGANCATVNGNACQGAVYLFKEPFFGGWAVGAHQAAAKLTASDGASNDKLGSSVTVDSGGATVVAGTYAATVGSNTSQGAAYVFQGPLWQDATAQFPNDGYECVNWLGCFDFNSLPWIDQQSLGWLYPYGTSTGNIWFYDPQWDGHGGWWWTSSWVFPWIYSNTEAAWFYLDVAASYPGARWFADSSGHWATH